jgi:hypothetical protein
MATITKKMNGVLLFGGFSGLAFVNRWWKREPPHEGFVGQGMLTAAVSGDVFTAPPVNSILAVYSSQKVYLFQLFSCPLLKILMMCSVIVGYSSCNRSKWLPSSSNGTCISKSLQNHVNADVSSVGTLVEQCQE